MQRLMVGFDGSDGGRDALELARVLATALEAEVSAVAVLPYAPLPISYAPLEGDAEEAGPLLEEARSWLDDFEVEARAFGGGSPAMVLTQRAEEDDVDLIVVGSPHRGPVGRVLIGSVADGLLHGAPCAVAVAPRDFAIERHEPFRTIAVAYDGTDEAKAALVRAEAIALPMRARIRVLTAVAPLVPLPGTIGYVPPEPPEPDKVLTEAVNSVDDRLAADGRRLEGPPGRVVAEACEEDVDLLVAGSRRYGPVMRVLLGSVSTKLVHKAPCPVLVVPRP
jgi:nucleotide-binding universal stress UspA family protein